MGGRVCKLTIVISDWKNWEPNSHSYQFGARKSLRAARFAYRSRSAFAKRSRIGIESSNQIGGGGFKQLDRCVMC